MNQRFSVFGFGVKLGAGFTVGAVVGFGIVAAAGYLAMKLSPNKKEENNANWMEEEPKNGTDESK